VSDAYRERLWAPFGWWAVPTVLVSTAGVAVGYPLGLAAGAATFALLEGLTIWLLLSAAAVIRVADGILLAGRAHLPLTVVSDVRALDAGAAARLRGVDADARAYLLLRPWVQAAVRVDLDDPADPTPYWYLSTRRPDELAAALAPLLRPAADPDVLRRPDTAG